MVFFFLVPTTSHKVRSSDMVQASKRCPARKDAPAACTWIGCQANQLALAPVSSMALALGFFFFFFWGGRAIHYTYMQRKKPQVSNGRPFADEAASCRHNLERGTLGSFLGHACDLSNVLHRNQIDRRHLKFLVWCQL